MQIGPTLSSTSTSSVSTRLDKGAVSRISDETLIASIADGDRNSLETLYARHHTRVHRFLIRLTDNEAVAEEIVNEVFLEVWRHADRFKAKSQVATWLIAIARNKGLTELRRRREEQLDDNLAAAIEDPADSPTSAMDRQDRSTILHRCLANLSPQHQEVINLVYYQEKEIKEVARFIGAPINTIKTRMFYARSHMSSCSRRPVLIELG
jgi:RNA polymerase sigma-70 factor (ECF subfamily)